MAVTPHDSTGTTFSFGGTNFTVTNIVYTLTDVNAADTIDISHLGQAVGSAVLTQDRPLTGAANDTGREVQIDYIGNGVVSDGATGTLAITGGVSLSKAATVSSSSVTLAVNDVVRGSVTFRVAR
ncbi:MAG: hypothetical protein EBS54_01400 [Betaproteobacteria bacterium]|nr:hypothetical protein [Betaproteobacteria bacterium]